MRLKFLIPLAILISLIMFWAIRDNHKGLVEAQIKLHEATMFRHESECYDLQACLETSLSFASDSDTCYPITPLWGWPGERTADLLSACKLFKKIRSVNGQ